MPSAKIHIIGFFVFSVILWFFLQKFYPTFLINFTQEDIPFYLFFGILGTLLPDIDIGSSKIHRKIESILGVGIVLLIILYFLKKESIYLIGTAIIGIIIFILETVLKHRGLTHSLLFSGTVSLGIGYFISLVSGLGFFVGFFVHILMDKFL